MLFIYTSHIFGESNFSCAMSLSLTLSLLNLYFLNKISTIIAEFLKIWELSGGQQLYFFS